MGHMILASQAHQEAPPSETFLFHQRKGDGNLMLIE